MGGVEPGNVSKGAAWGLGVLGVSLGLAACSVVFQDVWLAGGLWLVAGAPGLHQGPRVGEWGREGPGVGCLSCSELGCVVLSRSVLVSCLSVLCS